MKGGGKYDDEDNLCVCNVFIYSTIFELGLCHTDVAMYDELVYDLILNTWHDDWTK